MTYHLMLLKDRVRRETSLPVLATHAETAFKHVKYATNSACKSGCTYCCQTNIHPTLPELARILQEIEAWSDEQKAALKAKVAQVAAIQRDLKIIEGIKSGACIMLREDGSCSIYNARPLICRGMNSSSVEGCRVSRPELDVRQLKTALEGREALGDEGYKLPIALDIILNQRSDDLTPAKVTF